MLLCRFKPALVSAKFIVLQSHACLMQGLLFNDFFYFLSAGKKINS